ncbi:MAG: HAD family hydrolase, partial [Puniceicoccaceae bacterium]
VADTNTLKKQNIYSAVSAYLDPRSATEFVAFFISNNGIPREQKIFTRFDLKTGQEVLREYARRNRETFEGISPTPGFARFLKRCREAGAWTWVLSGGDVGEIRAILQRNELDVFDGLLAGPRGKSENLQRLTYPEPALFFGDSRHDYEVAAEFGLGFIFVSRYTQFKEWQAYFQDKEIIGTISDFREKIW